MNENRLGLPAECDCLIVGGGPAGSALAAHLAKSGVSVLLCDDGIDRRAVPEETLLPAALPALARARALELVAGGAVGDAIEHGSIWGSEVVGFQPEGNQGWRLVRGALDRAMRDGAAAAGALVANGVKVLGPLPTDGCGEVRLQVAGGMVATVQAKVVVLASGRVVANSLLPTRVCARRPETAVFCLVGYGDGGDLQQAVVEAVPDGWCWWLPLTSGTASVAAFVDLAFVRKHGRVAAVSRVLDAALGPAGRLREGKVRRAARATPSLRAAAGTLLIGDAASTVDPLSSQGVEKALSSAEHAACAVRTMLRTPDLRSLALQQHARWEAGLWRAYATTAAEFYARETRFAAQPFWRARSARPPAPLSPHALLFRHPRLRASPALRRVGDHFEVEDGFALPSDPIGTARQGQVLLAPLLAAFVVPRTLTDGVQYAARDPRVYVLSRAVVTAAVRALHALGFLVTGDATSAR